MDNSNNKDNATVIKPRAVDPTGNPIPPAAQDNATVIKKTGPSLDTGQAHALTQIGKSFQPSNSSTGFDKARQAANTALASNKSMPAALNVAMSPVICQSPPVIQCWALMYNLTEPGCMASNK